MAAANSVPVRWQSTARRSYTSSLAYIYKQDPVAAAAVADRVTAALAMLSLHPAIGTSTLRPGVLVYPIPKTGHLIEYRMASGELQITRWARQRRKTP